MERKIIQKLKELKVGIFYLFGSTVLGTEREDSDIDIGVVFVEPNILENSLEIYNILYEILSPSFS